MRDTRGATLQLIKIGAVLTAIFLCPHYRMLLQKGFIVIRRPLFKRIWKSATLICLGAAAYVPLYNCALRPICVFWARRIDVLWQLLSAHGLAAFWVSFALYLLALVIGCLKWCNSRIKREVGGLEVVGGWWLVYMK
jgi:hypothetical protein